MKIAATGESRKAYPPDHFLSPGHARLREPGRAPTVDLMELYRRMPAAQRQF